MLPPPPAQASLWGGLSDSPCPTGPVLWLEAGGRSRRRPVQRKEREASMDPPWSSTAAAFAAVPGLAQECPQEPLPAPIPPAPPTDGVQKGAAPMCLPPQTLLYPRCPSAGQISTRVKVNALPNTRKRVVGASVSLCSQ